MKPSRALWVSMIAMVAACGGKLALEGPFLSMSDAGGTTDTSSDASAEAKATYGADEVVCGSLVCNVEDDDFCCLYPGGAAACTARTRVARPSTATSASSATTRATLMAITAASRLASQRAKVAIRARTTASSSATLMRTARAPSARRSHWGGHHDDTACDEDVVSYAHALACVGGLRARALAPHVPVEADDGHGRACQASCGLSPRSNPSLAERRNVKPSMSIVANRHARGCGSRCPTAASFHVLTLRHTSARMATRLRGTVDLDGCRPCYVHSRDSSRRRRSRAAPRRPRTEGPRHCARSARGDSSRR